MQVLLDGPAYECCMDFHTAKVCVVIMKSAFFLPFPKNILACIFTSFFLPFPEYIYTFLH